MGGVGAFLLVVLVLSPLLFGVWDLLSRDPVASPDHEGAKEALARARSSEKVRTALGEDWKVEKVRLGLVQEEGLETTIHGTAYVVGPSAKGKLVFDYKRIGKTTHLRVELRTASSSIELE